MSLLFIDGTKANDQTTKWSSNGGGTPTQSTTSPPIAGGGYYTVATGWLQKNFTAASEIFASLRFQHASGSSDFYCYFLGDAAATTHICVIVNTSNLIEVRRGNTTGTVLATGSTIITAGWHHIQMRATINDATGVVQVRLDGSASNEINFSGDTKNAGTATTIDGFRCGRNAANVSMTDFVIQDTAGSANNTWPGDVTVHTLVPNGNGNSSQLVGSDGNSTDNYLLVDELPLSTADYTGGAAAAKDTYAVGDLPGGVITVHAVQVNAHWAKSDAGSSSGKVVVRSGGTDYADTAQNLSTTYATYSKLYETDPATSTAWTVSGVNALEAGMEAA